MSEPDICICWNHSSKSKPLTCLQCFHSSCSLSSTGLRQFDAFVEGTALADVNIVQLAGGNARQAVTQLLPNIAVSDGNLTISFRNEAPFLGNPTVAGIEVYKSGPTSPVAVPVAAPVVAPVAAPIAGPAAFTPIRINCGGGAYNDTQGRLWIDDMYYDGGSIYTTNHDIANTTDDYLYNTARDGEVTYQIPVPAGTYQVVLHFAEIL